MPQNDVPQIQGKGVGPDVAEFRVGLAEMASLRAGTLGLHQISLAGFRTGVAGTKANLWEGSADEPHIATVAGALTCQSSGGGAANDAFGGTGAEVVLVEYIDANGWERFGLAVMNGTTTVDVDEAEIVAGVPTKKAGPVQATALSVRTAYVLQSNNGANDARNVGEIQIEIATNEANVIAPDRGRALSSHFQIPRGQRAILTSFGGSSSQDTNVDFFIEAQLLGVAPQTFSQFPLGRAGLVQVLAGGKPLSPRTIFKLLASRSSSTSDVSAVAEFILYEDSSDPDPNPELQPPRVGG